MLLFQIQNIQLEREMALASNRSLAEQNLDMKPRLESQKELLVERYSQLEAVRETYRQHCSLKGRGRDEHCTLLTAPDSLCHWVSFRHMRWSHKSHWLSKKVKVDLSFWTLTINVWNGNWTDSRTALFYSLWALTTTFTHTHTLMDELEPGWVSWRADCRRQRSNYRPSG